MGKERTGLRWDLRAETRPAHERLDRKVSTLDIAGHDGLVAFLVGNALAHRALAEFDEAFEGHMRRRLTLLHADMEALSIAMPDATLRVQAPDFDSGPGFRYVIAGSAMGGKILARRHAASGDPRVQAAGRFLRDDSLSDFWRDVQGELGAVPRSDTVRASVVAGAVACFGLFEAAFDAAMARVPVG
ncbi:MAG: biliverdin-producing heme oxygenase [Pseudomonadota bacterium]